MKQMRIVALSLMLLALPAMACNFGQSADPQPTSAPAATRAPSATSEPADTATPDIPDVAWASHTDELLGLSYDYPEDWLLDSFIFSILATSQDIMDGMESEEGPDVSNGALMLMLTGDADELGGSSVTQMLEEAIAGTTFTSSPPDITSGPTLVTINGQEAAIAWARGDNDGQELLMVFAIIVNRDIDRAAVVAGVTGPDAEAETMPLMEGVIDSVVVSESTLDTPEPGDALPIFLGETVDSELAAGESKLFSFSGAPTLAYDIIVSPLVQALDVGVDVLDEGGESVMPNGEVDLYFGEETIRGLQFEDFGEYTVVVRSIDGTAGPFQVTLLEAVPGGDLEELASPGAQFVYTLETGPNLSDSFRFSMPAGASLRVEASPQDGQDIVLSMYDGDTGELLRQVDESFTDESMDFESGDGGFFTLEVTTLDGRTGTYNLRLTITPDSLMEVGDGGQGTVWMGDDGSIDFAVDLAVGDVLVVTAQPEEGFDLVLELLDSNDNEFASVDDGFSGEEETLTYVAEEARVYFLVARGFAGAAGGRFTIQVQVNP